MQEMCVWKGFSVNPISTEAISIKQHIFYCHYAPCWNISTF